MSSKNDSFSSSSAQGDQWVNDPNADISNIHNHPQIAILNQAENKVISLLEFASKFVDVDSTSQEMEEKIADYLETMKDIKNDLDDIIRENTTVLTHDYGISDPWNVERKSKDLFERKMNLLKRLESEEMEGGLESENMNNMDPLLVGEEAMNDDY